MPREADVPYFNYRPGGSEDWRGAAVCGPIGTKYPWNATGPGSKPAIAVGRAICRELCPVRYECLAYALTANIEHGTWGGFTESERWGLRQSERQVFIKQGRMTRYDARTARLQEEYKMVVVIAKTKFVPTLNPGDVGEVEDPLARVAVRNGYASLVGNVVNFDEWMYQGAELIVSGRTATRQAEEAAEAEAQKPAGRGGRKGGEKMVEAPTAMAGESA